MLSVCALRHVQKTHFIMAEEKMKNLEKEENKTGETLALDSSKQKEFEDKSKKISTQESKITYAYGSPCLQWRIYGLSISFRTRN